MAAIAVLAPGGTAVQALRRSLVRPGPTLLPCRTPAALQRAATSRLLDAIVVDPHVAGVALLDEFRAAFPALPVVACAPFRPDDGDLLMQCRRAGVATLLVAGVDDAVAGDLVQRVTLAARRRAALHDAPRVLRLAEPLQRAAWEALVRDVERPVRTADLARRLGVSREHLSRQFGAGGAPNLKRVIDLTRVACAAQLLGSPGYPPARVAALLHFASPSHLAQTVRRVAGARVGALAELGPRGVLAAFVRGRTRSRL